MQSPITSSHRLKDHGDPWGLNEEDRDGRTAGNMKGLFIWQFSHVLTFRCQAYRSDRFVD